MQTIVIAVLEKAKAIRDTESAGFHVTMRVTVDSKMDQVDSKMDQVTSFGNRTYVSE